MAKAIWNGAVLAQTDHTVVVEGSQYFPRESINEQYFKTSDTKTTCAWKGEASYYHIEVNGQRNADAAWTYADPKSEAAQIRGHVAFWKGVEVEVDPGAEDQTPEGAAC